MDRDDVERQLRGVAPKAPPLSATELRSMGRVEARRLATWLTVGVLALFAVYGIIFPASTPGEVFYTAIGQSTIESSLRLAVPIALTAIGGLYAEKSGVINIGLEGLLIISAFTAVLVADVLGGAGSTGFPPVVSFDLAGSTYTIDPGLQILVPNVWLGIAGGVLSSMLLAFLFAVICIRYEGDQIIAGLAVWLVALGLAPFASKVMYGQPSTPQVVRLGEWTIPVLSEIPFVGPILFDANPMVFIMLASVPIAWYGLNRTSFGYWVRASGENPKALDTVGVNVNRVRYAAVLISGFFAGIGGSALSLGSGGFFNGAGQTMVDGRGFIAIAAYLFGNYNPFGAFAASYLFSGLQALQIRLQGIAPTEVFLMLPYIVVVIVLVLVGRTRLPEAAGEHYESGED